ncbi:hypothetical protein OC834_001013 [Tilletia horrida]|nr:hypothetical protein OC834_001013 [Tilletia horrida]
MPGCASVPGIVLLSAAAVLLLLVTFSTPSIKSIYYLEAIIGGDGSARGRRITFGTLGYCLGNRCSALKLGYQLTDANQLFGSDIIPEQYTTTLIKGLTYTLILQPIACVITLCALLFALLSACPGCGCGAFCGSFLTGLAASVTLVAFCLDLALFVIAQKRINSIDGASATLGNGLWIVAAAWGCLVVGAILVCCGACCGGGGGGGGGSSGRKKDKWGSHGGGPSYNGGAGAPPGGDYNNHMRMDALAAERDRKQRQAAYDRGRRDGEQSLPQFAEYVTEHEVPLKDDYDDGYAGQHQHQHPAHPSHQQQQQQQQQYGYYDAPHHRQQSSTAGYPASYVPGVGQGYGEGRGGYGGGAGADAGLAPVPSDAAQEYYTPGQGPQPFRDGSYSGYQDVGYDQHHGGGGTAAAALAGGAALGAGAAYAAGRGAHGQSTQPVEQNQNQMLDPFGGGGPPSTYPPSSSHAQGSSSGSYYTDAQGPGPATSPAPPHIAAAPIPPAAGGPSRALPQLPGQGQGQGQEQGPGMSSEKDRLRAHYEAHDAGAAGAGGGPSTSYPQQHEMGYALSTAPPPPHPSTSPSPNPHGAAVAHLENYVDRMGAGAADSSAASPEGYQQGQSQDGYYQQQQQQYPQHGYGAGGQGQGYGHGHGHDAGPPGYTPGY